MIRLGYAGINTELADRGVMVNRTARLATVEKKGIEFIRDLMTQNFNDMLTILKWNEARGYRFYRASSDMCPHFSSDKLSREITENYTLHHSADILSEIGKFARENGHRITFHPAQYVNIGSDRDTVIKSSIRELKIHADIFSAMGLKPKHGSVMIFHGGGTYGNKTLTIERIKSTLSSIDREILQYISLENDERHYSPDDLLPICEEYEIPFTFDVFHYKCMYGDVKYAEMLRDEALWDRISRTWSRRGIKQKIHISSQRPNARMGAHSDYIDPAEINLRKVLDICSRGIDITVEAKMKQDAVKRIYNEFFYSVNNSGRIEWYLKL